MASAGQHQDESHQYQAVGYWGWLPPLVILILALPVMMPGMNKALFGYFNGLSRYTGDELWSSLTMFGDTVVAFALLLPWSRRYPEILWAAFLAALPATLWSGLLKPLFHYPRPAAILPHHLVHVIGPRLLADSFPSGHTTTVFTLAGVFILSRKNALLSLMCLVMAVLVGLSRSVVGAHWPLDELGGAFGGWLSAWGGVLLSQRWHFGLRQYARRVMTGVTLSCVLALFFYDGGYPDARPMLYCLATVLLAVTVIGRVRAYRAGPPRNDRF